MGGGSGIVFCTPPFVAVGAFVTAPPSLPVGERVPRCTVVAEPPIVLDSGIPLESDETPPCTEGMGMERATGIELPPVRPRCAKHAPLSKPQSIPQMSTFFIE